MTRRLHHWIIATFLTAILVLTLLPSLIANSRASVGSQELISALSAQSSAPYALGALHAGQAVYTDRRFVFTAVPDSLVGKPMVRTPNADKASSSASLLSFQLSQAADLYVAYDARASALPAWLSGWEESGMSLGTDDTARRLYRRAFAAGAVTLGGNLHAPAAGALSNYSVIVVPTGGAAPTPTSPSAPTPSPTVGVPPSAPGAISGEQWAVSEIALSAAQSYDPRDAYLGVAVTAVFANGPRTLQVRGFWDGGNSWRVRFTPPSAGRWSFTISNNRDDRGLRAQGVIEAAPARDRRGFLRVDPQQPHSFRFDSGERYFLLGTTAYEVLNQVRAGSNDWRSAFSAANAHGISKVRLLVYPWVGSSTPQRYPDVAPFLNDDNDRLDLEHWRALDSVVDELGRQQMVADLIMLAHKAEMLGTEAQEQRLVRYLIARYGAYPHVIWTLANEYDKAGKPNSYWSTLGRIVAAEDPWARENGARRPLSVHQISRNTFTFIGESWPAHAIIQYTHREGLPYGDQWGSRSIIPSYGRGRPVVNDEPGYYTQTQDGVTVDRNNHRRAHWAIVTSGGYSSTGDARPFNGSLPYKSGDWDDPGEAFDDLQRLQAFFTRRVPRWWQLKPQKIVTSGTRVYVLGDPSLAYVAYAAGGGRFTLALPSAEYSVLRYDPRTGTTAALGTARGSASFTMPDSQDWALLLVRR